MEIKQKIGIPRDPRKSSIFFIDEIPLLVENKIDNQKYKECLDSINSAFKPKYSFFRNLSIILFLTSEQVSYDEEVDLIIKKVNEKVKNDGISFMHPKYTNYTELILYIY